MEQENAQGWAMRWSLHPIDPPRGQRVGQKGNTGVFSPEGQRQRREGTAAWNGGREKMEIVYVITRFLDIKCSRVLERSF